MVLGRRNTLRVEVPHGEERGQSQGRRKEDLEELGVAVAGDRASKPGRGPSAEKAQPEQMAAIAAMTTQVAADRARWTWRATTMSARATPTRTSSGKRRIRSVTGAPQRRSAPPRCQQLCHGSPKKAEHEFRVEADDQGQQRPAGPASRLPWR